MRFDAEVSDSASSCRRGEPVKPVSAKPGGASSPMRVSPTCTANGAAAHCSEMAARAAARVRTAAFYPRLSSLTFGGCKLGGDPQHSPERGEDRHRVLGDRKSTRLNSSHLVISYAVFCLINIILSC